MDNFTPQSSSLIVAYIDGELTPEEMIAFEKKMEADNILKEEYERLLETRAAIRYYGIHQQVSSVRQQLKNEKDTPIHNINRNKKWVRYTISIAASLLFLMAGYSFYYYTSLSGEKVFTANYQTFELPTNRSTASTENQIEYAYRQKNYKEVLRLYNLDKDQPVQAVFFSGVAAMELHDDIKAVEALQAVLAKNKSQHTSIYNDEAEFYLSLSYIRLKKYSAALPLLQKIQSDPDHIYHTNITNAMIRKVRILNW